MSARTQCGIRCIHPSVSSNFNAPSTPSFPDPVPSPPTLPLHLPPAPGQATARHIPLGRGFSSCLSFFNFGEDHWTQIRGGAALQAPSWAGSNGSDGGSGGGGEGGGSDAPVRCSGVDLWKDDKPASQLNGTQYGGYLFAEEAVRAIHAAAADPAKRPFFMFLAWQNNHPPLQVPQSYVDDFYPPGRW